MNATFDFYVPRNNWVQRLLRDPDISTAGKLAGIRIATSCSGTLREVTLPHAYIAAETCQHPDTVQKSCRELEDQHYIEVTKRGGLNTGTGHKSYNTYRLIFDPTDFSALKIGADNSDDFSSPAGPQAGAQPVPRPEPSRSPGRSSQETDDGGSPALPPSGRSVATAPDENSADIGFQEFLALANEYGAAGNSPPEKIKPYYRMAIKRGDHASLMQQSRERWEAERAKPKRSKSWNVQYAIPRLKEYTAGLEIVKSSAINETDRDRPTSASKPEGATAGAGDHRTRVMRECSYTPASLAGAYEEMGIGFDNEQEFDGACLRLCAVRYFYPKRWNYDLPSGARLPIDPDVSKISDQVRAGKITWQSLAGMMDRRAAG